MGAGRVYWGQIVVVLCAFLLSAVAATQWVADALGYQPQLGPPDAMLMGFRLYAPWKFLLWWYHYDAYARDIFQTGGLICLSGVAIAVLTAFAFSLWRSREAKNANTYGTARWATARDIKRLHLTSGDGVVLGAWQGDILRHDGDEHVLVVAPTNTGKSVGVSLPTGLVWRHSYIALDLKGELKSVAVTAMAAVSWRYPADLILASNPAPPAAPLAPPSPAFSPEQLNLRYRIDGDKPDWRPLAAFDDGRQVFIEMPASMKTLEAPPLYVVGDEGPELVNYRVLGNYYVVDRLFAKAELKLGSGWGQKKVQIHRQTPIAGGARG